MKGKQGFFYISVIGIFLGAISPQMFSEGMFMDGTTYAVLSRNLAFGIGSFWDIHFTSTLYSSFFEHPPLAFGLQSIAFEVFGDTILVERAYSLLTVFLTGWVITRIWRKISDDHLKGYAWLPLLFWIAIPLLMWTARNNMLENTLMIFTTGAVFFSLKGLFKNRWYPYLAIAGICIFLGLMTKGLVALFPLSLPFWIYILTHKINFKAFFGGTLVMIMVITASFLLIFSLMPESIQTLKQYLHTQVLDSLTSHESGGSRFSILKRLIGELIPVLVLVFIVAGLTWKRPLSSNGYWHYVMLALGLSGTLPIMISLKQGGFYIVPALPFFALAAAYWVGPRVNHLVGKINPTSIGFHIFQYGSVALLIVSIGLNIYFSNGIGRDKATVRDVKKVVEQLPKESTISVTPSLWKKWGLHAYFHRYGFISLEAESEFENTYALLKNAQAKGGMEGYEKVALGLKKYALYKKTGQ